ncbi:MAG: hypothetical protein FE78DRAFT_34283 [Acidomyces sp. 'richmondensis']|nr:MAG: hypothetical protein FE78DRAFT_34283 [Acidomyces sp. 'richmondensis']
MLRCPPSLITLNNTDILDFEIRTTSRPSAPFSTNTATTTRHANIRLSSVPTGTLQLAITLAEDNIGRKRAASSASRATICCTDDEDDDDNHDDKNDKNESSETTSSPGLWTVSALSDVPNHLRPDQSEICHEAARALEEYILRQPQALDGAGDETHTKNLGRPLSPKSPTALTSAEYSLCFANALTLNAGALELRPAASPPHRRNTNNPSLPSRNGLSILHPIHHDAYPTSVSPPAFSSARARRRRHARSHDNNMPIPIQSSPPELQHHIQNLHLTRRPPELAGTLNPDAPVFIPRTRYGATLESRHSSSSLRIRSSAERNIESAGSARLSLRRSNERIAAELLRPGLMRFPVFGELGSGSGGSHRAAGPNRVRGPPTPPHHPVQTIRNDGVAESGESSSDSHRPNTTITTITDAATETAAATAVAIPPRTISLAYRPASGMNTRIASTVVLTPFSSTITRSTSGEEASAASAPAAIAPDAATPESLLMRNSPLDELAERLSRVRPRSVGRSWERPPPPPGNRTSALLAGELFRVETPPPPPPPPPQGPVEPSPSSSLLGGAGGVSSPIKRKPVPMTTPKVQVYDDSLPPATQPWTPADLRGARRARGRSDTIYHAPLLHNSSRDVASPPERHPHRHTYPAEAAENDLLDAHLAGLEEDRRRWVGRRWEEGSLQVTPPREGRFERFLS